MASTIKTRNLLSIKIAIALIFCFETPLCFYRFKIKLRLNLGHACLDFISDLAKATISLFIIVDPFGNIPIFVGLTENDKRHQKKVYNTAVLVGLVLLLVFAFTGTEILSIFGISMESFEIAGGILLLIISIKILISGTREQVESPESIGAVPIAMPLLVGPGAITTTIFNIQTYQIPDQQSQF